MSSVASFLQALCVSTGQKNGSMYKNGVHPGTLAEGTWKYVQSSESIYTAEIGETQEYVLRTR